MRVRVVGVSLFVILLLLIDSCQAQQQVARAGASRIHMPFCRNTTPAELTAKVEQTLAAHDFDRLETLEHQLRDPDIRLVGGVSQIYYCYAGLGGYAGSMMYGYSSPVAFDAKRRLVEQWLLASPGSVAGPFAVSLLESPGGDDGLVAYTFAAQSLMLDNGATVLSSENGLSWPLIKIAYAARDRQFGLRNRDWNTLCKLAVAAEDRAAAQATLVRIAGQWDPAVWDEAIYFEKAAAWAAGPSSR